MSATMDRYRTIQIVYASNQSRLLLVTEAERALVYTCAMNGKVTVRLGEMGILSLQNFKSIIDMEVAADRSKSEAYWEKQAKKRKVEDKGLDVEKLVDEATGRKQ